MTHQEAGGVGTSLLSSDLCLLTQITEGVKGSRIQGENRIC